MSCKHGGKHNPATLKLASPQLQVGPQNCRLVPTIAGFLRKCFVLIIAHESRSTLDSLSLLVPKLIFLICRCVFVYLRGNLSSYVYISIIVILFGMQCRQGKPMHFT